MLKTLGNQKGWHMSSLPYTEWPHLTTTPYVKAYVFGSYWVTSNEAPQLHPKKGSFSILPTTVSMGFFLGNARPPWWLPASLPNSSWESFPPIGRSTSPPPGHPKKSTMQDNVYCRLMLRCIWHPKKSATFVSPWDLWNSLCTFRSLTVAQRLRDTIKVQIFSAHHPQYLSPYHCNSVGSLFSVWNKRSDDPAVNDKQPPSRLIFQLLPENSGGFVWEAINAGGQRAFVCQVPDGLVLGRNISSFSRTFTTQLYMYLFCMGVWVSVLKWRLYVSTYCACLIKCVCDSHLFPENSDSTHVDPKFPVKLSPFRLFSCNLPFHQNRTWAPSPGDSALVLTLRSSNEAGMKNQSLAKPNEARNHPTWCHQAGHSTDSQVLLPKPVENMNKWVRAKDCIKSEKTDLVYLALKRCCFREVSRKLGSFRSSKNSG